VKYFGGGVASDETRCVEQTDGGVAHSIVYLVPVYPKTRRCLGLPNRRLGLIRRKGLRVRTQTRNSGELYHDISFNRTVLLEFRDITC
jgi:hypothetical protein